MPYHVSKSAECSDSKPWAVIKNTDSSVVACHETEKDANDHMAALYANEDNMTDRSGKVLNSKNKDAIHAAIKALNAVLDSAEPTQEEQNSLQTALRELRADWPALNILQDMCNDANLFLTLESDPEDAEDRDVMNSILDQLQTLVEAEAAEPEEDDSMYISPLMDSGMSMNSFMKRNELAAFEQRFGKFGEREVRFLPLLKDAEVRDSGAGPDQFTVRGHAAVYNRKSLDLGGFEEVIAPGAFDDALSMNPDVHLLWDHDTRYVLARTLNKTLDLRSDEEGLSYWARVAPVSYANDLRILMERGDIDQASFAFTVADDVWEVRTRGGSDLIVRTINKIDSLFDVTICAKGAYPAATSSVVRSYIRSYAESKLHENVLDHTGNSRRVALDGPTGEEIGALESVATHNNSLAVAQVKARAKRAKLQHKVDK
jgi:HK97 family phage prohead protease